MPNLLRSSNPKARIEHQCFTCRTSIPTGTRYRRSVYLGDDGLYEWVACIDCEALMGDVYAWAGSPHEGVLDEDFDEFAHMHIDDPDLGEMSRAYLKRRGCDCETCDASRAALHEATSTRSET